MKTTLIIFGLLLTLTACDPKEEICKKQTAQAETSEGNLETSESCVPDDTGGDEVVDLPPIEGPVEGEVPFEATLFGASATFTNFDSADIDKVQEALEHIQKIVRTNEFRERVLKHTYQGVLQFVDNNGLTNAQIYQKLLDGSETLNPAKNNTMDLQLELYTNNSTSTVGYTYPNTLKIWMNTKFFDRYNSAEVARNVFHEWTHKLGFGHDSSSTSRRPYSVPYGLGAIIQDMALDL